jgi:hypothetical protein
MLDEWHLPDNSRAQQVFNYTGDFEVWAKPRGITMVHLIAIGGGAGGACGYAGSTSTLRGGGSGGCQGGQINALFPASLIPDLLYINVGAGSAGTASGTTASASSGGVTYVCFYPSTTYYWINANGGTGGNPGTSSAGGAASGSATASIATSPQIALTTAVAGTTSASAGSNGSAAAATVNNGLQTVYGGAGGGGASAANGDTAGGGMQAFLPYLPAGIPGGTAAGGAGQNGIALVKPMIFYGGTGGGSYAAGTGGAGGNGATGCGGGGGGGGLTGGAGGNGGNGLVVITCI